MIATGTSSTRSELVPFNLRPLKRLPNPTGEQFCLFHPGDTRSRAELISQLGQTFDGVISTDDYSVYNGYTVKAQQKCLAHLRRHFKKVIKLNHGNNPILGQAFIDLIDVGEAFPKGSFRPT